jgi:hypothetical protein
MAPNDHAPFLSSILRKVTSADAQALYDVSSKHSATIVNSLSSGRYKPVGFEAEIITLKLFSRYLYNWAGY